MMSEKQKFALEKIKRHLNYAGSKFHVRMCDPISDDPIPTYFVAGHVGDGEEMRWFDPNYSFIIGPRGAIKMVNGPTHMKEWQNKRWCGMLIKLR